MLCSLWRKSCCLQWDTEEKETGVWVTIAPYRLAATASRLGLFNGTREPDLPAPPQQLLGHMRRGPGPLSLYICMYRIETSSLTDCSSLWSPPFLTTADVIAHALPTALPLPRALPDERVSAWWPCVRAPRGARSRGFVWQREALCSSEAGTHRRSSSTQRQQPATPKSFHIHKCCLVYAEARTIITRQYFNRGLSTAISE